MTTADKAAPSFHQQLESLLREQLRTQPRNHAARLKLLELYYETRRVGPFMALAKEMDELITDKAASSEWQKCASMGRMLVPESQLFSTHGTDRIEFVGAGYDVVPPPAQVRRLGDDERYAPLFKGLGADFETVRTDPAFQARLDLELTYLARRPSALLHARSLSEQMRGAQIYIKREDTSPRDTHLIISVVGQALLAQRLGRKALVTSTIDGRRGVVMASIAARLGLEAVIFMDAGPATLQNARHATNLFRMKLLGGQVMPAGKTDVREAALQYWARTAERSLMVFGLEGAPAPYPLMAREFASTIGRECMRQLRLTAKRPADLMVARGGNNADALGLFPPLIAERGTRLVCIEPQNEPDDSGASADPTRNQMNPREHKLAQTILEGMEYPSVVREHRWLRETGRVEYLQASRDQARRAIGSLSRLEGLTPALETAYALGWACDAAAALPREQAVVVMMAEDADKDFWDIGRIMGVPL